MEERAHASIRTHTDMPIDWKSGLHSCMHTHMLALYARMIALACQWKSIAPLVSCHKRDGIR